MGTRRGNSEGSLRKRSDGRWEARLVLEDGTRRSLYARTRQEASRLLADALRDKEKGLTTFGDRQTVEQYLTSWLERWRHTRAFRNLLYPPEWAIAAAEWASLSPL